MRLSIGGKDNEMNSKVKSIDSPARLLIYIIIGTIIGSLAGVLVGALTSTGPAVLAGMTVGALLAASVYGVIRSHQRD